jgi:predicted ATP-grasp superfamily ATP-dependent carboligase
MSDADDLVRLSAIPTLQEATLVLSFGGWMDGGDVSTGTVRRLIQLINAREIAEINPEPFYVYNLPGSMEYAAVVRPHTEIKEGVVESFDVPRSAFYCHEPANLLLFVGNEPNMHWQRFGKCVFQVAHEAGVRRILFIGSYGGVVPHTRQPRLYVTCSQGRLIREMVRYGVGVTNYAGPGSFTTYLMTQAPSERLEMVSLVAEIPSYLQGPNLSCIEAVTRRLAKILQLPLDLDSLRAASTRWELEVSAQVEKDEALALQIRRLEQAYDNELLREDSEES